MTPTVVLETYWRFAAERQEMFFRRLKNPAGPWTQDAILGRHRFTNAFRASDRVSQYLIRDVQYRADRAQTAEELVFRTLLFKFFNRIETWEAIESQLGPLTWSGADLDAVSSILNKLLGRGNRIYSAAYIMPAPRFGHQRKHENHLALIASMMNDKLPVRIARASSLREVYEMLLGYPGIGPFLAFQYAIDLNYSTLLNFSESDFVIAGPGALDGIAKCFSDTAKRTPEEIIQAVTDDQERAFKSLGLNFKTLFGRRLQLIDCQNLFCEVSKYARIAHPNFQGISGRLRIKQSYQMATRP